MEAYIRDIIQRFGGRLGGSEQEKQAQLYTRDLMKGFCDETRFQPFHTALDAHFESLKIFCAVFWFCLLLCWVSIPAAAILASLNFVLFTGHFLTYRHWLDFLFPQKESWNVTGVIEPKEQATSTLIIAGHIDSVHEFQWWYWFGNFGGFLNFLSGFMFLFQAIFFVLLVFTGNETGWAFYVWLAFVIFSPATLSFFFKHGKLVVDGALDNLTGVAMAMEMGKIFSKERLQRTRLKIVSFGSEEPALRGSFAYARDNKAELLKENATLINLDTIKEKAHLSIVEMELNTLVKYPKHLVEKLDASFAATNTPVKKISLNLGATDGSAFHIQGLPAVSVIGMESAKLDPCYHTRKDNLSNLNPDGLYALRNVLTDFIRKWDTQQL
jgi:Peptidase family M28